jgi:hypothetical protein
MGASGAALATLIAFFVFLAVRTESSAILWHSLPRLKLYIVTLAYLVVTSIFVITEAKLSYYNYIWVGLAVFTVILFKTRANQTYQYLKINLVRKS